MELDNLQSSFNAAVAKSQSNVTSLNISNSRNESAQVSDSSKVQYSDKASESAVYAAGGNADDKKGNVIDDKTRSTAKLMDDAVNEANKKLTEMHMNQELQMSMHNVTKAIMVKVVDTSTKEIIREYPPQKLQDMIAKMWLQAGILVDEKR